MTTANISDNRRTEYGTLREEIYRSDRTCVILMGFLLAATGASGDLFFQTSNPFILFLLAPIWFLAYWYFTEKRFLIKLIASYLKHEVEAHEDGLGWEHYLERIPRHKRRPSLPFNPYYIETIACGVLVIGVPIYAQCADVWEVESI